MSCGHPNSKMWTDPICKRRPLRLRREQPAGDWSMDLGPAWVQVRRPGPGMAWSFGQLMDHQGGGQGRSELILSGKAMTLVSTWAR